MTDLDRVGLSTDESPATGKPSTGSKSNVGKSIVASFKNRSKRQPDDENVPAASIGASVAPPPAAKTDGAAGNHKEPAKPANKMALDETAPMMEPPLVHSAKIIPVSTPAPTPAPAPVPAATSSSYHPHIPPAVVPTTTPVKATIGSGPSVAMQLSAPATKPSSKVQRPRTGQSRRARLRISRVDPWSVMKTSLLFSVAGWVIFIVATWVIFSVLDGSGLYEAINSTVAQIFTSQTDPNAAFNIKAYVNATRATAVAALVGAVNVVIITALATIFAFLYNLSAVVMGGIEVTMAED